MKLTSMQQIRALFKDYKAVRSQYEPLWSDISAIVGITVDGKYMNSSIPHAKSKNMDQDVEDPTAALSVIQAGDYLDGIIWGTGEEALSLEPSEYIKQRMDVKDASKYFEFRTRQLLNNMNHSEAGFSGARKACLYDLTSFGTGGVGAFLNPDYPDIEENPYFFRNFGIDNTCIGEGKNGKVDILFVVYNWSVQRIVDEFDGKVSRDKLPEKVKADLGAGKMTEVHTLVQGIIPRDKKEYLKGKKGKLGTRYRSVWFYDDEQEDIFYEEGFRRFPVGMCRMIKVRGEVYGRAPGTILINSIKAVNYMVSQSIQVIEKMQDPAIGIWNNALFGGSALDSSSSGIVVLNNDQIPQGRDPFYPIHDVGDPHHLIGFLIPYLNEKIATGMKVDILLDFASQKDMTATESMQRYSIRGKSVAGNLTQIKDELLERNVDRCLQLEDDNGLAGVNPKIDKAGVEQAKQANRPDIVIPEPVLEAMEKGIRWYKVRYNNELERMIKNEAIDRLIQAVNGLTMISALYPQIIEAVEWYKLWKDVNDLLGINYIKDEDEFKVKIMEQAQMQRDAMMLQGAQMGADALHKGAQAEKEVSSAAGAK